MENQGGIVWIEFKEWVTDEEIKDVINRFYNVNKNSIHGMEFNQFATIEQMRECKKQSINPKKKRRSDEKCHP